MGNFKEIDGDLIELFKEGEFDVIVHGCNCFATMGAGIALTMGNEFPEAKAADKRLKIPNGKKRLGKLSYAEIDGIPNDKDKAFVFNLYTQFNPGPDFKMKALKDSLGNMIKQLEFQYEEFDPSDIKIGFPLIGCGIAGGDWNEVKKVIKKMMKDYDVTAVHFTQKVIGVNYWPTKKKSKNNLPANIGLFDEDDDDFFYFTDDY